VYLLYQGHTSKKARRDDGLLQTPGTRAPELVNGSQLDSTQSSVRVNRNRVSRRIPPGDFMAVTGTDGRRLYMSVKSESLLKHQVRLNIFCFQPCSSDTDAAAVALLEFESSLEQHLFHWYSRNHYRKSVKATKLVELFSSCTYVRLHNAPIFQARLRVRGSV
jgi:hypothetical protein